MTPQLIDEVKSILKSKIKEPIDDLILAGENHVKVKLSIQNRSLSDVDNEYLAELIAESTLQIVVSMESAQLIRPLSSIS